MSGSRICVSNRFIFWGNQQSWRWTIVNRLDAYVLVLEVKPDLMFWQHYSLFFLLGCLFYQLHFANFSILFHAKVWQTCFHHLICIKNKRIYFQLLMEFQSMGNEMNCYKKPNSKAQAHRIVSKLVCSFFFQISRIFSLFYWFLSAPSWKIILNFSYVCLKELHCFF